MGRCWCDRVKREEMCSGPRKLTPFWRLNQRKNLWKHMKNVHDLVGNQLDTAMEKSINKKAAKVENGETEKEPRPQLHNFFPMSASDSEEPLSKIAKIENSTDHSLKTSCYSNRLDALKQKLIKYENQLKLIQETPESTLLEDQNRSPSAEVSTSNDVMGNHEPQLSASQEFQAAHFQNTNDIFPKESVLVVQQKTPSNFDEDSRQICHQIMRVAANSTKDRQDCFRQLLFATVFAFESSPTCTNVEEFFRMMGERYAKK
ncbi:hypothetical protein CRE_14556 [Caenorhabditis remanei]|uniref:Uncharacterized protein n=1 Tax=Caenorhabditis remanei TaxID=31234 RepID=E3M9I2_CAERE|nr:hypothetical protein CRE_14556 [Caenorhabditis remanei]